MKRMHLLTALTAALVVAACGTADPTAPAMDRLEAEEASFREDPIGSPHDPVACVKAVPASDKPNPGGEPLMILVKTDRDETCPPGFAGAG